MRKKRLLKIGIWFFSIAVGLFLLISLLLWIYKDEICQLAIGKLNENLKAKVTVSEVDLTFWGTFPNLSIDFNHVFVQDAIEGSTERDTLLYSDRIRCKLNPLDIWYEDYNVKTLEVNTGVLKLKVDSLGANNYDILKETDSESSSESFNFRLDKVEMEKFRFSYSNVATAQEYDVQINTMELNGEFSEEIFTTKADADIQIISAKSGSVPLVSNKPAKLSIGLDVNAKTGTLEIPQSLVYIADLPFQFDGNVDEDGFNFNLKGKDIPIKDAANNLFVEQTQGIKKFSGAGTLLFELEMNGTNDATSPVEIECDFGVEKGMLRDPDSGIQLSDLSFNGKYSNIGGAENEYLKLQEIGFKTRGGPFKGAIYLTKFESPHLSGSMNGVLNLAVLRSLFSLSSFQKLKGSVDVSTNFEVQAEPTRNDSYNYRIDRCEGKMRLYRVDVQLINDKRVYKNINGLAYLRNDRIGMEDVSLKVGSSDFKLDGVFKDVIDYFRNRGNLVADVQLKSKWIDLKDLGADTKQDKMIRERSFILPDDIEGNIFLDVDEIRYEKHIFSQLIGNMNLRNRKISFPQISVTSGGADIRGSLIIDEGKPEIFYISSQIVSNNINFQKLFAEWDNFKQDVIQSANISGTAQANVKFDAPFDLRNGILMNAIKAQIGVQVDNGRLVGVESFKEITESLKATTGARLVIGKDNIDAFERKLKDLKFNRLKNTLLIKEGVISIPLMSIQSSALDIEMSGKHTFENQIDYRFGFRFRDIKQNEYSEFGTIEDDGTGRFVFMRMYGDLYDPNFEWDKTSSKAHNKEIREIAKRDAKSILKTGLGLFKNDTTVKQYIQERRPHEELIIHVDPLDEIDELMKQKQPKKDTKIRKWVKAMREESEKENAKKEEFDFD